MVSSFEIDNALSVEIQLQVTCYRKPVLKVNKTFTKLHDWLA